MKFRSRDGWLLVACLAVTTALAPAPQQPDPAVKALAQAKLDIARRILDQCKEWLVAPPGTKEIPAPLEAAEEIQYWVRQVADARLDLAENRAQRLAILEEEVKQAKIFESEVKDLAAGEASGLTKVAAAKAEFARVDTELRLAREKAGH
jgi:hypothetical protein